MRLRISHPIGHHVRSRAVAGRAVLTRTKHSPGLWRLCASLTGTESYRAADFCVIVSQPTDGPPHFHATAGLPLVAQTRRRGNSVTIVTDRPDGYSRFRLIAARGTARRIAIGRLLDGNGGLFFKLRLSPGTWRVHATAFNDIGGPTIAGRPWSLTIPGRTR